MFTLINRERSCSSLSLPPPFSLMALFLLADWQYEGKPVSLSSFHPMHFLSLPVL